jgi:hypothetical protein
VKSVVTVAFCRKFQVVLQHKIDRLPVYPGVKPVEKGKD